MDNRITKSRLATFITYDFIKVIAVMLALCVMLLVVFNAVGDKPTSAQTFYVLCDNEIIVGDDGGMLTVDTAKKGANNGGFSYDIIEVSTKPIETSAYGTSYMLKTSAELGDDDIFITQEKLGREYLDSYFATDIVGFVDKAFQYCTDNDFFSKSGTINEEKIRNYFLKTRKKDNRFRFGKTEEGVALEIQRIKTIWDNATVLKKVFTEHSEIFSDKFTSFTWGGREITGSFAIDLSKLTGGAVLSNAFKFAIKNQETGEITSYTSDGIYLFVGNNQDVNGDLDYESLAYIRTIIEKYSNFIS